MDPKILDKIRKCLALGTSPNEHEAAAGLRQAQKMMSAYGISDKDLAAAAVAEAKAKASTWEHMKSWESMLAGTVADIFGCQRYFSSGNSATRTLGTYSFYGPKGRQELASYAFTVLQRIVVKKRARFVASLPEHWSRGRKGAEAESFIVGFLSTVRESCAALVPDEEEKTQLQAWHDKRGLRVVRGNLRQGSSAAAEAGRAEGKGVSLHRPMGGAEERRMLK